MRRSRRKKSGGGRGRGPTRPVPPRLLLVAAASFLIALAYLWGREQTLASARRVETLRGTQEALQRSVDRLELEMSVVHSSDRIVELARQRLGLDFPNEPIRTIAVAPAPGRRGPDIWTYVENAVVMAVEGMQRHLSPEAQARERSALPDTTGGP